MIKSYLIVMFVMCFLFAMNGEAKLLTAKEVKAIKTEAAKKKNAKAVIAHKKAAKKQTVKTSKMKNKVVRNGKSKKGKQLTTAKTHKKMAKPRKVVRLDFDKKDSLKPRVKARKELKKLAKNEKSKKKSFKAIQCTDGHIVGHQAFCSTTAKAQIKKHKGRSLASKSNENKKLK